MVRLIPMTESEFEHYIETAIQEYARAQVNAGHWSESQAIGLSRGEYNELLPNGTASKDQHLFSIVDATTGDTVGMIWYADRPRAGKPAAFVYDFRIDEKFRRKGYATAALDALDELVKARGIFEISLHVFGDNLPARALYDKVGYQVSDLLMVKKLDG